MPNRMLWLVDMGDGTWAVCCLACRLPCTAAPNPEQSAPSTATAVSRSSPSAAAGAADPDRSTPRWAAPARTPPVDGRAARHQPTRRTPLSPTTLPPHHRSGGGR
jgi:hypothetical protein